MADYSSLSRSECQAIVERFGWTLSDIERLKGGAANSSFRADLDGNPTVVITVLDNHSLESAHRLVELTDWLIENGVHTPPILRDVNGDAIAVHAGHPVITRPFLSGAQPDHLSVAQAAQVGRSLRELHSLRPPREIALPDRRLPDSWIQLLGGEAPSELTDVIEFAIASVGGIYPAEPKLIHGDLFPDNMIWGGGESLQMLDWETASLDLPVLDVGFCAIGMATVERTTESLWDSLISGYQGKDPIHHIEADFPRAAMYAGSVLMFHRYIRHVVRYPNADKRDYWRLLLPVLRVLKTRVLAEEI